MNKKLLSIVLIALMAMVVLAGCSKPAAPPAAEQPAPPPPPKEYRVNIATATTGGVYYPLGNTLAQIWSKNIPGVRAAAQATAGTPQNIELMQNKEVDVAFGQNGIAYYAYTGTGTYEGKKVSNIRGMLALYPNVMHVVAAKNANIKTVADFEGKRVVPGAVASATEINSREIFAAFGLNYREEAGPTNLRADYVGYNEAADLMKDGHVQGAQIAGGLPTAAVMDMMSSGAGLLLSLGDAEIKAITEKYPWYFPITIPANTYPNQPEAIKTVAVSNMLIVREDLDDELVYKLTKAVYDYAADFVAGHQAAKDATLENSMNGMIIPVHPGAAKYFTEKGIKVPDNK
jgi:TRAP transporter TAXI family solute receptor